MSVGKTNDDMVDPPRREMLFVSHANPEDNELALWISLQLAKHGYPVWCDLTKLLGGESFWNDIEDAIRHRTIKFLYLLSRTSNEKSGPRNELALANGVQRRDKLKDFVIPLWIDSLVSSEFNVEIVRTAAIRFQEGWARGLAQLLKKLEEDGVPKNPNFNPSAVTSWWRNHLGAGTGVLARPEQLATNWYPLEPTPLYFHELRRTHGVGPLDLTAELPYPAVRFNQYLVSFAPAEDFDGKLGSTVAIAATVTRCVNPPPDAEHQPRMWSFREERSALTQLLRQVWERLLTSRGLSTYTFANKAIGLYFTKGQVEKDQVRFKDAAGGSSRRDVVGYKTLKGRDGTAKGLRHWHFSLEARPTSHPVIGYTMRPHVLFSDDGAVIWENKDRLHRARRSQCKGWWNDKWRDLIAATMWWLADGESVLALSTGSATTIRVHATPIMLESPVSYNEPEPGSSVEESALDIDDSDDDLDEEMSDESEDPENNEAPDEPLDSSDDSKEDLQ